MNTDVITVERTWKLKLLLLCYVIGAFLFVSLFWSVTKGYWQIVDVAFFKAINGTLKGNPRWQLFWAFANHRLADWVEDLCVLGFFIAYVARAHKTLRLRKVAELIFCILFIGMIIYLVNQKLFRENTTLPRLSPSLVVEDCVRLSKEIPWMKIKDSSSKSFPGDHGTTAVLFAASFFYLARKRLGLFACLYAAFLCMPRLIAGAHWLSDILVGSGCIALLFLSTAFCTPLFTRFSGGCERLLKIIARRP
jgi:membrane-associated phospholipid phosphatase